MSVAFSQKNSFMSLKELVPVLHALNRTDKLRAIQFIVSDLAREEKTTLTLEGEYPVWSPHTSFDAGKIMLQVLERETGIGDE